MAALPQPVGRAAGAMPEIPLIDLGGAGAAVLVDAERARADALVDAARRDYGAALFTVGEALSRRWLAETGNPYLDELDAVARRLGRRGIYLLNLSYEWFCTARVAADPAGAGSPACYAHSIGRSTGSAATPSSPVTKPLPGPITTSLGRVSSAC